MKLSEVLATILSAEDEAADKTERAKAEAEKLRRETHADFERKRKEKLDAAHAEARSMVESARNKAEDESMKIKNSGQVERKKMYELFEANVDSVIDELANETASACVKGVH